MSASAHLAAHAVTERVRTYFTARGRFVAHDQHLHQLEKCPAKNVIPVTDSVVVYGLGHNEDDPSNQVYTTMSGRANKSFVLDMSEGGCAP